ncbi:hypothetical protein CBR_g9170 [Chara braunii]|uniref:Uncharacterized protein n=1 Tax=Chara braunii TaxID=69332 RepID=A0A388KNZ0_CHABU|nr:hypothetical protein CBR_g9170 [Chara braunii]|eukprot:GBG71762.1 hypothetical protein CBR_g9170 [Chara braunii]
MAVVLHAEGGDLRKVTRIPKSEAELVELHVEEEKFKRCTTKYGGGEGNEREEYGRWERHPTRMQKLCSSFLHMDQGVLLIGTPHAGLLWELLRAGYHVFACDGSSKDISYMTKAIDILGKDARNDCTVERQKMAQRPDRDMYHKLGKKRNKMWDYLFQGQPKSPFENDYIIRKAMTQEEYGGYHKAQVGAFAMFVARCEQIRFGANQATLSYDEYNKIAKTTDSWNPIESDEETETSDLEIEERVKRLREGMQSVPACSVPNANREEGRTKSGGASSPMRDVTDRASSVEQMQTDSPTPLQALDNTLIHDNRHCLLGRHRTLQGNTEHNMMADDDEDDLAVPDALPRLMPGDDIPNRIVQTIDWKIELPACQGIETIQLGCSQLGGQLTTHFAASVGEAMSQTNVKIMGVDKGTRNVDKDPSNVASYGPPLLTQAENQSASQMESPTPSTNVAISDRMQQGGYGEHASEVQKDSDKMMKLLDEAEKDGKRKLEGSTTSQTVINCISLSDEGVDVHVQRHDDNEDVRDNVDEQKEVDDGGRPARRSTREIKKRHPVNV